MKVFISYSSRDKWVAGRISGDLSDRGIETFLDEKDIETGDPLDDTIQDHLEDCDELLMLLSPTALNSHWVMLEIGGAKALKKRLVPILLHVGANELPSPLNKGLARDLNEIEKYYEEIEARHADNGDSEQKPVLPTRAADAPGKSAVRREFQIGDFVRLPIVPQDSSSSDNDPGWNSEMNEHLGKIGRVVEVDEDRTVRTDIGPRWWWAMDWLEPAEPPR